MEDTKHWFYLFAILGFTTFTTVVAIRSHKAREWMLFLMAFTTPIILKFNITFFGRIWYRGTARGYEVTLIDLLAFSLLVAVLVRPKRGQGKLFWPAGLAPMLIYFAYCIGRTLCSDLMILSGWEVYKIFRGIIIMLAVAWYVRTERELGFLVLGVACAVSFEGFVAVKLRYLNHMYRTGASLEHPNSLSMYLCLCAPVLYAGALSRLPVWTRRFCVVGTFAAMIGVILTISRSGFVAWGFVMLAVTVLCVSPRITLKKVLVGLTVVGLVSVAIGYSWKTLRERLVNQTDLAAEGAADSLGRGWYIALAKIIIADRGWGVGINNWSWYVTNEYQARYSSDPKIQFKPYPGTGPGAEDWPDEEPMGGNDTAQAPPAHNLPALTAGELGWAGLITFGLCWLRWLDMGQRFIWKRSPEAMHRLGTGIFIGLIGVLLQSMTEWAFRQQPIYLMFHILLGALAAMYRVRRKPKRRIVPVEPENLVEGVAAAG